MRWYKKLWFKFVLEVIVSALLWVTYFVVRHLLPKKWRVNDGTIKKWMRDFSTIATNIASSEDSIGEVLKKSQNLFEYAYDQRSRMQNSNQEFKLFIRDLIEEVDEHTNHTFMNMIMPKLEAYGEQTIVYEIDSLHHIVKLSFNLKDEDKPINFYVVKTASERAESIFSGTFACTKDYKFQRLTNILFEKLNNRLYFSIKNDFLFAEKLEQENNQVDYFPPEELYNDLVNEIMLFKKKNIQRSYILCGLPGTGKTSFSLELSQKISGKILKLDTKVFTELSSAATRVLIEGLECDFILVDDIDRMTFVDLATFLYMLESLKSYKNCPTLLATVNNIHKLDPAIIRPGRFDDIIEFELPNLSERKIFMKKMLEKNGINLSMADITKLAKETDGMSQAFLKEYCLQMQIEENIDKVVAKIKKRHKYLTQLSDNSHNDENQMEDILTAVKNNEFDGEYNEDEEEYVDE